MRIESLPNVESKFRSVEENKKFDLKPFSIPVPGETNLNLDAVLATRSDGFRGFYESEKTEKDKIVIHYTVGNVKSDVITLSPPKPAGFPGKKNRLSVAYVIARDGTIYQLFPSYYWSFHLGSGALGGNGKGSKSSIGIELSNFGPLLLSPDKTSLETVYSRNNGNPVDTYCKLSDTDQYIKLAEPYRGYQYFAAHTDEQYESLIILLRFLTATYNIPRKFIDEATRFDATEANAAFKGISTHVNFRPSGKTDIGPAFDWQRMIDGVTSQQYLAFGTAEFGTMGAAAAGGAAAAAGVASAGIFGSSAVSGPPPSSHGPVFQTEADMEKALIPDQGASRGGFGFGDEEDPFGEPVDHEEEYEVQVESRNWVDFD